MIAMSEEFTLLSEEELLKGISKVNRVKHRKASKQKSTAHSGNRSSSQHGKNPASGSKKSGPSKTQKSTDSRTKSGSSASRKTATHRRKRSWLRTLGQILFRTVLSLVIVAGLLFGGLCLVLNQVFNGPSPAARDVLTMSLLEASGTKWVPGIFLGDRTVEQI